MIYLSAGTESTLKHMQQSVEKNLLSLVVALYMLVTCCP